MPSRAVLAAFGAFVLIGGFNFVAVRFSNRELAPMFGAGVRFTSAAVLLLAVLALRRLPMPRGRALWAAVLYGLLNFTAAYGLAYWSLTTLPAGIGAVVFAATPLFTVFLAPLHRIEPFRVRGLVGSLITLVGIVILANPAAADRLPWLSLLAMLGSAAAASEAGVVLKMLPSANPISTNAVAMVIGGPLLLAASGVVGERWALPTDTETWVAVSYLAVIGSIGLFADRDHRQAASAGPGADLNPNPRFGATRWGPGPISSRQNGGWSLNRRGAPGPGHWGREPFARR